MLLTPNGIAVGTPFNGIAYATKADFVFTSKFFEPINPTTRYPVMWQAALSVGSIANFYGVRSAWWSRDYLNPNMQMVYRLSSNDEFASTSLSGFGTSLLRTRTHTRIPYHQILKAVLLGNKEIIGLSTIYSMKSATLMDWGTKSYLASLPMGVEEINALCDAGEYGLFVGTTGGQIYRSVDGGATLIKVGDYLDGSVIDILHVNNELMLASTYPGGRLYASNNGGNTWSQVTGWTYGNISCMAKKTNGVVYAATLPVGRRAEENSSSVYTITITR